MRRRWSRFRRTSRRLKQPVAADEVTDSRDRSSTAWLPVAFFASGFAALVYQVVWQRVLFANFGISIEAVTIVVTAFLAGLGIGNLIGGRLSLAGRTTLARIFGIVEMSVGAYGIVSVPLFRWLAVYAAGMSDFAVGSLTILLVVIPTVLMGVTLPLLVAYRVVDNFNVGESVGQLYFVNTAGSALASLACAAFLMGTLGELKSVLLAASLNISVGAFVLLRRGLRAGSR